MSSDAGEKKRVQFRAPKGLVQRADSLATVLETDRTTVILSALREYLRDTAHNDELKQESQKHTTKTRSHSLVVHSGSVAQQLTRHNE